MSILDHLDLTPLSDAPAQAILAELEMPAPEPEKPPKSDEELVHMVKLSMLRAAGAHVSEDGMTWQHLEIGAYMAMEEIINTLASRVKDKNLFRRRTLTNMAKLITRTTARRPADEW